MTERSGGVIGDLDMSGSARENAAYFRWRQTVGCEVAVRPDSAMLFALGVRTGKCGYQRMAVPRLTDEGRLHDVGFDSGT